MQETNLTLNYMNKLTQLTQLSIPYCVRVVVSAPQSFCLMAGHN